MTDLVRSADEDALLADAHESWTTISADPQRLAAYRAEAAELEAFDAPLPPY